tara:strand:+ start:43279 stop:44178 length:900 start_codon:yes stop_codon:yes gene_type:complete
MGFDKSMFKSIQSGLESKQKGGGFSDILKFTPPTDPNGSNVYTVRILPVIEAPEKTFFEYISFGWESLETGKYIQEVSPSTHDERCYINEARSKIYRLGTEDEKERVKAVRRRTQYLVNVYIVDDPIKPENNGTVKIMRYGKQLDDIIRPSIMGEDSDEIGDKAFMLSKEGMSLKVKVTKNGDFPSFVTSRFANSTDIGVTKVKSEEIYKSVHDLESIFEIKTNDQLEKVWKEHYECAKPESGDTSSSIIDEAVKEKEAPKKVVQAAKTAKKEEPVSDSSEGSDAFDISEEELEALMAE